jgi:hypothetical protein
MDAFSIVVHVGKCKTPELPTVEGTKPFKAMAASSFSLIAQKDSLNDNNKRCKCCRHLTLCDRLAYRETRSDEKPKET